ncbi:hypothetical protein ABIF65_000605 [Bradyrhizobium japonicum]|nr:hypothetical protein [Bradyrhizobium japonicum]MCP1777305.1 hypothetical protein [Bradyrhizobium japonicum]MCP1856794.1 hypothetical protein [Bradyrhizobium japonicum]MCP1887609.1 hypothetical protein [Bradyrhizobium japonicum]MCP1959695.1 hypothetical protein [Bradyrhizobium japonicum]
MTRHLTRAHLARGVAGAVSTLVLCATAAFTIELAPVVWTAPRWI